MKRLQELQAENYRLKAENNALKQRLVTRQRHEARHLRGGAWTKKDQVAREIAKLSGLEFNELWQRTRAHRISRRRQEVMYIMQEFAGMTSIAAGEYFGMDHATALHAKRRVELDLMQDKDVSQRIAAVVNLLQL